VKSGILEKLKELINSIEEEEKVENMTEEITKEEEKKVESEIPDYLECTAEETAQIVQLMDEMKVAKGKLADLLLQFENNKSFIVQAIKSKEQEFYESLNSLRVEYGLPDDGISVRLPSEDNEKIVFVKD